MRNRYVLLADLPLVAIAAFGAFALRFDWLFLYYRPEFLSFLAGVLIIKPVVFYLFGMYGRYWRYASAEDLIAVTLAVSTASVVVAMYVGLGRTVGVVGEFSRQAIPIDWLLTLMLTGGLRMSIRVIGDARQKARKGNGHGEQKRVLVVGAGEAGTLVVREMQKNPQLNMHSVGFLDDDPAKLGKWIHGVRVLGSLEGLRRTSQDHQVDEVVIAMPAAPGTVVRSVSERCREAGVAFRTVPGVFELIDGQVSVSRLRNVDIADLLRRSQVVTRPGTAEYAAARTVLVTGAGGSIGSELCRQVAYARPACLVLLGHGENSIFDVQIQLRERFPGLPLVSVIADVRDAARIERVFDRFHPDIVFHAAAHKHVPLMEENPEEAATNNVLGTLNVVNTAVRCRTDRLVLISTDKAVSPRSIMGASKRLAEMIVRDAAMKHRRAFAAVRFGNVLGSRGSVVPLFKAQIERGGPITITHPDMKRFFMTIPEAVHLVLQAGGMASRGELFALDMGEPVSIVDLAADLVRLSGLSPEDIPVVFTGLRPGEKLTEALWEPEARVEPTANPEVLKVIEDYGVSSQALAAALRLLEDATTSGDAMTIQAVFAQCVPTFTPGCFTEIASA
jgi:FlaA1/EpsC-like NDP-sugar epimerase